MPPPCHTTPAGADLGLPSCLPALAPTTPCLPPRTTFVPACCLRLLRYVHPGLLGHCWIHATLPATCWMGSFCRATCLRSSWILPHCYCACAPPLDSADWFSYHLLPACSAGATTCLDLHHDYCIPPHTTATTACCLILRMHLPCLPACTLPLPRRRSPCPAHCCLHRTPALPACSSALPACRTAAARPAKLRTMPLLPALPPHCLHVLPTVGSVDSLRRRLCCACLPPGWCLTACHLLSHHLRLGFVYRFCLPPAGLPAVMGLPACHLPPALGARCTAAATAPHACLHHRAPTFWVTGCHLPAAPRACLGLPPAWMHLRFRGSHRT